MLFACTIPKVAKTWFCNEVMAVRPLAGKFSEKGSNENAFDEWARFPQTDMKCDVSSGKNVGVTWQKLQSARHTQGASPREN